MPHNVYQDMKIAHDECYTTENEADKLVRYIEQYGIVSKQDVIWLPFDNEFSNIYKALKKHGFTTIMTNLENGQDFYFYQPSKWDLIITNPPFSGRTDLMNRLIYLDKPFIILQATQFFNNQYAVNFLCEFSEDFKLLLPRSRMSFLVYDEKEDVIKTSKTGAAFYSFWLCYKTNLKTTFNQLPDSGNERIIERYDEQGNIIEENHMNLFNCDDSTPKLL